MINRACAILGVITVVIMTVEPCGTLAQGPTIESGGLESMGALGSSLGGAPGSTESRLGRAPGTVANALDSGGPTGPISGGIGPGVSRAPASISGTQGPGGPAAPGPGFSEPPPTTRFEAPSYGSYSLPEGPEDDGPPNGLTLDSAIGLLLRDNLDLRGKSLEIPQAQADVLTAGLRANPVFYADAQLIPYGSFNDERPGGQTQYDINISHPFDLSGKRRARTIYATSAKRVVEAQYQNAVRVAIDQLYGAFLNVLAARQTVYYSEASVEGLSKLLEVTNELYKRDQNTRADVNRVKVLLDISRIGRVDSEESLKKAKRELLLLLNRPSGELESLEVRGTIDDRSSTSLPPEELTRMALALRPDLVAFRLGVQAAEANVRLQLANRLSDVYVLYQPYTLQDNSSQGLKSARSWALGVTVPLPLYDRNQGGIARARLNVTQSQIELAHFERQVEADVQQATYEYDVTTKMVDRIRGELEPAARSVRDDTLQLYTGGEVDQVVFLNAQREYQNIVKQYLDTLVRRRRAMLALNTAVGQRLFP